ncbi:hypothetical protein RyT2_00750 [Pseudolactococcus yaeyamensis]
MIGLFFILILAGCSKQTSKENSSNKTKLNSSSEIVSSKNKVKEVANYYSYLDGIDRSVVQKSVIESFTMYDKTDPQKLQEISSDVFIAKVVSIDKADVDANVAGVESDNLIPNTYGKLEILKSLEGDAAGEVQFIRSGGIIKEKERYKNAPEDERQKHNRLRAQSGKSSIDQSEEWIEVREEGDIELHAGETYLFFATYDEKRQAYFLIGFEYGALLLEDEKQPIEKVPTKENEIGKTWEIKNESTGEEKKLGEFLEKELEIDVTEK